MATGSIVVVSKVLGEVFKAVAICEEVQTVETVVEVAHGTPTPAKGLGGIVGAPVSIEYGIVGESV